MSAGRGGPRKTNTTKQSSLWRESYKRKNKEGGGERERTKRERLGRKLPKRSRVLKLSSLTVMVGWQKDELSSREWCM